MRRIACLSVLLLGIAPTAGFAQYRNAFNIRFQNIQFTNPAFNGFAFQVLSPTSPRPTEIRFQSIQFRGLDAVQTVPVEDPDHRTGRRSRRFQYGSAGGSRFAGTRWTRRDAKAPTASPDDRRRGIRHPFQRPIFYGAPPKPTFDRMRQARQPFAGDTNEPRKRRSR